MKKPIIKKQSKKGQFYLFTAVILCVAAFFLATPRNQPSEPTTSFAKLADNYEQESPQVINNALYNVQDVYAAVDNYTTDYLSFARTEEPFFSLAYILVYNNTLYIKNRLNDTIMATTSFFNDTITPGALLRRTKNTTAVSLTHRNLTYAFDLSHETELRALFELTKKENTQIRKYG